MAPPLFLADPYEWGVDEVVQALCSPNGLLGQKVKTHDLPKIERDLRANDVDGEVLLSELIKDECLRNDLGIHSIGQLRAFKNIIRGLRDQSRKWQESSEGLQERTTNEGQQATQVASVLRQLISASTRSTVTLSDQHSETSLGTQVESSNVNCEPKPKRRRIAPQFIQAIQRRGKSPTAESDHHIDNRTSDSTRKTLVESDNGIPGYLGLQSLPVNQLFYSDTQLGKVIEHGDMQLKPLEKQALERDGSYGALQPERLVLDGSTETVFNIDVSTMPQRVGQALYVNGRMKHFLNASDVSRPGRYVLANSRKIKALPSSGRGYQFGFRPYQQRLLKYSKDPESASITIFNKGKAERHLLRDWAELDSEAAEVEDIYDHLEAKWANAYEDDPDLPIYGESGSEGNVYSDSDESEVDVTQAPKASRRRLTNLEVAAIVEKESSRFLESWQANKKPQLEMQAYGIWKRARLSRREDIWICEGHVERLKDRLDRMTSDLVANGYEKADDLRKQCASLYTTLGDKAVTEWKLNLLRQNMPPPRPDKSKQINVIKEAKRRPVDLQSDEEDLSSEEDYRFIDDSNDLTDEDYEATSRLEIDNPQAASGNREPPSFSSEHRGIENDFEKDSDVETSAQGMDFAYKNDDNDSPDSLIGAPHTASFPINEPSPLPSEIASHASNIIDINSSTDGSQISGPTAHHTVSESARANALKDHEQVDSETENADDELEVPINEDEAPFSSDVKLFSSDLEPEDPGTSLPSKKNLPFPSEFGKLRKLDRQWLNLICAEKRRDILLAYLVVVSPTRWPAVNAYMKGKQSFEIIHDVWEGLAKFKGHHLKLRNLSEEHSKSLLQLCVWFVAWFCCFVPTIKGIPKAKLDKTLESGERDFQTFWTDLEETSLSYKEWLRTQSTAHTTSLSVFKKAGGEGSGPGSSKPGKKLVKLTSRSTKMRATESQEARDWRNMALERKQKAEDRMNFLRQNMVKGTNGDSVYINQGTAVEPEDYIEVNKHIASRIKPHQIVGINFLWRESVAAQEGLLLAHVMGLGKTMQCITLLVTIAEAAKSERDNIRKQVPANLRQSQTLILCPAGLVENWHDELLKWVPLPVEENIGDIRLIDADLKTKAARLREIQDWVDKGGVLIVPYSLLVHLVHKPAKTSQINELSGEEQKFVREALFQRSRIVIADEAQHFKNPRSQLSLVMKRFRTKARIALTGSPLANNLEEYFQLLDWTSEGYLGDLAEFKDEFVNPISAGLYVDALSAQKRQALTKLKALDVELSPKVLRADYASLHGQMGGKTEFVLRIPASDIQEQCYNLFIHSITIGDLSNAKQANILAWLSLLRLICNHPKCFMDKLKEEAEPVNVKGGSGEHEGNLALTSSIQAMDDAVNEISKKSVRHVGLSDSTIIKQLALLEKISLKELSSPGRSQKMNLLASILRLSKQAHEKILIFSQSIPTLDYVQNHMLQGQYGFERIDGSTKTTLRQEIVRDFNEKDTDVMLVSTRAGGAGFNLFGASRVVILDESWNPMNERQAIGRAYRIGQERHVYVYRFVIAGSFEELLQNQAVFKLQLATRVVDKKDIVRSSTKDFGQYLRPLEKREQKDLDPFRDMDPRILDNILRDQPSQANILSIVEAESFFAEEKEPLTEQEEKNAKEIVASREFRRKNGSRAPTSLINPSMTITNMPLPSGPLPGLGAAIDLRYVRPISTTSPIYAQGQTVKEHSRRTTNYMAGETSEAGTPQGQMAKEYSSPSATAQTRKLPEAPTSQGQTAKEYSKGIATERAGNTAEAGILQGQTAEEYSEGAIIEQGGELAGAATLEIPAGDNAEHSGYESKTSDQGRRPRKANARPFNMEPVQVERTSREEPITERFDTGHLPTTLDGAKDALAKDLVKVEPSRSQSKSDKTGNSQTSFREPPSQFELSEGSKKSAPTISLLTSDEDSSKEQNTNGTRANTPKLGSKRPITYSSSEEEDSIEPTGTVSRNRPSVSKRGRSGFRSRGNHHGLPMTARNSPMLPYSYSRTQANGLNVRQPPHGLPRPTQLGGFMEYRGLRDAIQSGTNNSSSKTAKRDRET